jgi:hypothetical protein
MFVERLHDRLGTGKLLLTAVFAGGPAESVVLLLHRGLASQALAVMAQFSAIFFSVCYSVTSRTLRQTESPAGLRSRITAAHRWVSVAVMPLGAIIGGVVSTQVGLRGALAIGCVGLFAAPVVAWASPLRHAGAVRKGQQDPPSQEDQQDQQDQPSPEPRENLENQEASA